MAKKKPATLPVPPAFDATGEDLKSALRQKIPVIQPVLPADMLSTGSTLLNLALSGRPQVGIPIGGYIFFVGDSSSGKTWLTLCILAEASMRQRFNDYRLVYDPVENGALMDVAQYFGTALAARIEPPIYGPEGVPGRSITIDDFYTNIHAQMDRGPCIYILDSMDALMGMAEEKKRKQREAAAGTNRKVTGEMGDGKAKKNASGVRGLLAKLQQTGSILIVVAQTRDVLDQWAPESQTYSGGHALKFYAAAQIWTRIAHTMEKTVEGKPRKIGVMSEFEVKKNRITGKEWSVRVPILWGYGMDDIGSCIDYLVFENHWTKSKEGGTITAEEFQTKGQRETLIKFIEKNNLVKSLRLLVAEVWENIEKRCVPDRLPRY